MATGADVLTEDHRGRTVIQEALWPDLLCSAAVLQQLVDTVPADGLVQHEFVSRSLHFVLEVSDRYRKKMDYDKAKILLGIGADPSLPDSEGKSAFTTAIEKGVLALARLFVSKE